MSTTLRRGMAALLYIFQTFLFRINNVATNEAVPVYVVMKVRDEAFH